MHICLAEFLHTFFKLSLEMFVSMCVLLKPQFHMGFQYGGEIRHQIGKISNA